MPEGDFVTRIEWWGKERFQGRVNRISTQEGEHVNITEIAVPDDEVVCDMCNESITTFPVCVVTQNALCKECQTQDWHIQDGDDEYFETAKYHLGEEEKMPGKNMGGRKRT